MISYLVFFCMASDKCQILNGVCKLFSEILLWLDVPFVSLEIYVGTIVETIVGVRQTGSVVQGQHTMLA